MLWFTCECIPVWLLFMVISDYTEGCSFCHSVPFPRYSCVCTEQDTDTDICFVWETLSGRLPVCWLIHYLFLSRSIPVWMSTSLSALVCSAFQSRQLTWLIMGQHIFQFGLSYGSRFWLEAQCYGPLCRAKSRCWQREKFQEQKRTFPGQQL